MQLNPGSSAGILDDIDFICGSDSTSYPTADKVRNVNRHYYKAVIDILKTEGRLQWDDSNLTTLPEYAFTLVAGQRDYSLPTNLLKIWALEIVDTAGNNIRLQEIDINDPLMKKTITDFESVDGVPKYYDIRGDSVFLYPSPAAGSVTLTDGGKMFFAREIDAFTTADTTQEPGIAEPFHRILSLGAAYDWLTINDTTSKADRILQQYEQLRMEMREFYSTKNKEVRPRLVPQHDQRQFI